MPHYTVITLTETSHGGDFTFTTAAPGHVTSVTCDVLPCSDLDCSITEHSDSYREGSSPSQWSTGPTAALASELLQGEEADTEEEVQLLVVAVAEL